MTRGESRLRFDDASRAFREVQKAFLAEKEGPELEEAYAKLRALVGVTRRGERRSGRAAGVRMGRYVPSRGARAR